jgi:hypothetical protein
VIAASCREVVPGEFALGEAGLAMPRTMGYPDHRQNHEAA